jgi:AraC-like DNA-binding protein
MNAKATELFAAHRVASGTDVEYARDALSEAFLPVDFPSASASASNRFVLNALKVGRLTCGYMSFDDAVRIETAEPESYHFDIPTSGRSVMRAVPGTPVYGTERTAGVFMPGRPAELDCDNGFAQIALMVPRAALDLEMERLLDSPLVSPVEFEAELGLSSAGGHTLLQAVDLIDGSSRQTDGALSSALAARHLEQVLIHCLLFSATHNYSAALRAPAPAAGSRPVSQAVELLQSDPARAWTIPELAADTCMSVRSLQEGFRRTLGTTPTSFLRRLRLERVREDLLADSEGTTRITEVAFRWGFVHLGRFAAAYAERFGERPSDTVRTASGAGNARPLRPESTEGATG